MRRLRQAWSWLRADPPRAARWAVGAALVWIVLRPPFFPAVTHFWTLRELRRDCAAAGVRVAAKRAENARLYGELKRMTGADPFLREKLAREAGFLRPDEFDYLAVAEALPPCRPPGRRTE